MNVTSDEHSMSALRTLARAYVAVTGALERDLQNRAELPLTWFEALLRLSENEGALRMQDLADQIMLSRSGITRLIHRLEGAGLVVRDDCSDDRRGCFAVLTDVGRAKLEEAWPHFARSVDEHFAGHLSVAEARRLQAVLMKVLEGHRQEAFSGTAGGAMQAQEP